MTLGYNMSINEVSSTMENIWGINIEINEETVMRYTLRKQESNYYSWNYDWNVEIGIGSLGVVVCDWQEDVLVVVNGLSRYKSD